MNFKGFLRICALLLALITAFCALPSCDGGEEREVVSDRAVEYFNKGVSAFNIANCISLCRASATVVDRDTNEVITGYVLYSENVYKNLGTLSARKTETFDAKTKQPTTLLPTEMTHLSTSYLKDGRIYYRLDSAEGEQRDFYLPFEEDYSSAMGLYSLGNASPAGKYAVKDGDTVRVDLRFSPEACQKSQALFIENMQAAVFSGLYDCTYSTMLLSAFMDAETGRISSYTITFTGDIAIGGKNCRVSYRYEESFLSYDAAPEIVFPDLSAFSPLKKQEKE